MQFNFINDLIINKEKVARMLKLISIIYIGSLIGLVISFMLMGFVPLFAAEPYMAKFFKGEYQAPYNRVAFLYRTSRQLLEFLIPLKVLELFNKISLKNIILVTLGIILIAISLNRSPILSGALVAISIVVALKKSNSPFRAYLIAVFFAYVIGSSIYFILGSLYPDSLFGLAANNVNFFESIAYGAPDITDQLQFLNAFLDAGQHYTYGLTFIGGLIPFNFPWNPSVYTLLVLNNTNDISDIASGGLRLPPSLWGYVSFGWIGVIILPLLSGFLLGYLVKKVKAIINKLSEDMTGYFVFFFIQFAFTNIGGIFVNFFTLSIYALPGIFLFYVLVKSGRKKIKSLETVN